VTNRHQILVGIGLAVGGLATVIVAARFVETRRFQSIRPGTPAAAIEVRFGRPDHVQAIQVKPGTIVFVNGCGDKDRECWFYLSRFRGDHYICFDERQTVTCQGAALIWR
jgi:hypothetical protein